MPRYYFRLTDGVDLRDPQGDELIDDDVACRAALEILTETLDSRSDTLLAGEPYVVEATEGDGRFVYRLTVQAEKGQPS